MSRKSSIAATEGIVDHASAHVFDLESRLDADHHQSIRLWLRMLSCTVLMEDRIRSRLRNEFGITLPRFDLMAQLERHPEGLRMGELSKRMMVTGGNITGITDQLEREKLVMRVPDADDRRAYSVKLTEAGRKAFERMASVHEAWVEDMLGGLSVTEKNKLIELLSKLKHHLNGPATGDEE
ncbi:MarR family winged helix-turn-helix transcriptional regulator [Noviherbaspirillum saxi]|uniref:MarR family winged helix-turn-helix transcriptional regulator n=1 Tax=Noviherbaspirillum saxi TaxID=2320863 RepID=UPI0018F68ED6|nr:MarR family transcriptional regulator [Noviherbaspirillum saxi]